MNACSSNKAPRFFATLISRCPFCRMITILLPTLPLHITEKCSTTEEPPKTLIAKRMSFMEARTRTRTRIRISSDSFCFEFIILIELLTLIKIYLLNSSFYSPFFHSFSFIYFLTFSLEDFYYYLTQIRKYTFPRKKKECVTWHLRGSRGTLIHLKNFLKCQVTHSFFFLGKLYF